MVRRIVTKWSVLAIKVLLAAHKSVSKAGYSEGVGSNFVESLSSRRVVL
jgi:hypothetical protein